MVRSLAKCTVRAVVYLVDGVVTGPCSGLVVLRAAPQGVEPFLTVQLLEGIAAILWLPHHILEGAFPLLRHVQQLR